MSEPQAGVPGSRRARREGVRAAKGETAGDGAQASRAGRNLPAAIGVGLGLLAAVLGGLFLWPLGFTLIAIAACLLGVWEIFRALQAHGTEIPIIPVVLGAVGIPLGAYFGGSEAQLFAVVASCAAVLLWQSLERAEGAVRGVFGGVFVLLWVPFLISYAVLPLHAEGPGAAPLAPWPGGEIPASVFQLATILLLVVANDTFGYLVGATLGRHPLAPKISPKKSWEGLAGSFAGAIGVGVLAAVFLLGEPWWIGAALAVAMVAAATAGDLAESMVKRELGIKDMSSILPGHGGMMDRLDSILFAVPVAYLMFSLLGGG